uniref:Uncharacterized protein n=1 Tax=Candidatus Kentrum sp. LFY TaxID=2126342 RepID=A0A450UI55_9GAMM|nr:MAG: hypothetical protein BECKLFY1418A_GA0070994_102136 [Candidatus Kentron sp. LFY]
MIINADFSQSKIDRFDILFKLSRATDPFIYFPIIFANKSSFTEQKFFFTDT